tara:strand:+ start:518 stop:697 length:180 start_codon:yes stop_codon:yes gene_type:complete
MIDSRSVVMMAEDWLRIVLFGIKKISFNFINNQRDIYNSSHLGYGSSLPCIFLYVCLYV